MPYKNIVFAKLEKRLLNDPRWFGMSEDAQLNYIKLILIASETYNRIPRSIELLCSLLRTKQRKSTILSTLKEIELNFPKFKKDDNFYYFEEFETKTNYIRAIPSNAEGTPKVVTEKEKDIYKEEEKEEEKEEDTIKRLFISSWSRSYLNLSEMQGVEKLVIEYGYDKVRDAFRIAGENNKTTAAYVRGILLSKSKEEKPKQPEKRFGNSKIMNELYGDKT